MGLSAQPALHVTSKVAAAYAALRANMQAGNSGPLGSRRRVAAEAKPVTFRPGPPSRSMTAACPGSLTGTPCRSGRPPGG